MKSTQNKILVVAPDIPYPPNHGGRVDIWNRLKVLKSLGFKIDLISTGKAEPSKEDLIKINEVVDDFIFCPRKNKLIDMFRLLPLQVNSRKKLEDIQLTSNYNFTILETEYVYKLISNKSFRSNNLILRVQNNEKIYFKELGLASKFGLHKLYYYLESFKFGLLENKIISKIKNYMFISLDEFTAFNKIYPKQNAIFLPTVTILSEPKPISLQSMNVLFIGSFFMVNNMEGILWYINKVHHLLQDIKDYKLIIAGNSKGQDISWLTDACAKFDNVKIYDSPVDLGPIYSQGAVFINPMLHGTGVKLKTIEAIQNSLPVVSTTIGNQGTGLKPNKDILVANEPKQYASFVRKLLCDKIFAEEIVADGQKTLAKHFNQSTILKNYLDSL